MKGLIGFLVTLTLVLAAFLYGLHFLVLAEPKVTKSALQARLSEAAMMGADARAIGQLHANRATTYDFLPIYKGNDHNLYDADVPLSRVIEDIRANAMAANNPELVKLMEKLARSLPSPDPVQRLTPRQREVFAKIENEAGARAKRMSEELNALAGLLIERNQAVETYMRRADFNLYLALASIIISVITAIALLLRLREKRLADTVRKTVGPLIIKTLSKARKKA